MVEWLSRTTFTTPIVGDYLGVALDIFISALSDEHLQAKTFLLSSKTLAPR